MAKYGYIGNNPDNTPVIIARQVYNPTGVQTNFTFNVGYTPGYLDVYLNGVKLLNVSDYSATDGSVVGITSAAQNGDSVEIVAYKAFTIGQSILGISSAGTSVRSTGVNVLNFVGAAVTDVGGNQLDISITPGITTADVSTSSLVVAGISTLGNVTAGVVTSTQFSGNISGVAATFTGNVSIAGTLTYEDVTNIDSIGLVTARSGVRIDAGGIVVTSGLSTFSGITTHTTSLFGTQANFTGVVTASSYRGDGSQLTGISAGLIISDDTTTNSTFYPTFTSSTSGTITSSKVSSTKLTFNPSTGTLTVADLNSTSDLNLKENIKTIKNSLDTVNNLRGVSFNWKSTGKSSYGVIAQELEKILPELVITNENKSVNYNGLIGILIEAVKELSKEIKDLQEKVL